MTFPFNWNARELVESDLVLFRPELSDIVVSFLPCRAVHFVGGQPSAECDPAWQAGVAAVRRERRAVVESNEEEYLFLPLWAGDESLLGVAILVGEPGLFRDASAVALLEKSRLISGEMARIKQHLLDPLTGLLGGFFLRGRLDRLCAQAGGEGDPAPFVLCLLEMYPRVRDAAQALSAIAGNAAFLEALIGHLCVVCHPGNGIFAFVLEKTGEQQAGRLAEMLLRWVKREGVSRASIGMAVGGRHGSGADAVRLLEQGWDALGIARKRGPFALCFFQGESERAAHPLCPPSARIIAALRRIWQRENRFALLLLRLDQPVAGRAVPWRECLGQSFVAVGEQEAFVLLSDCDESGATTWCHGLRQRASARRLVFSVGAAVYPQGRFRKTEMPGNCRKALIHAGFLGPGAVVFFNGVSLNISGDISYNEGDLARAVREYRLGLELEPRNANLLNSLGVGLAQMNLYKKAIPLFQEVLSLQPDDFMALFNLGFACLACRQEMQALAYLERALALDENNFDLLLQLGKLYCKAGRFQEAARVLGRGEQVGPVGSRDISHGAVHRYLGEARMGLGENKSAMVSLQRAVRHNPRDAAALSMLGELYCRERQGDEIALSLCRQAVALDETRWEHWARLAFVLLRANDADEALRAVRKGCVLAPRNTELLTLLARVWWKMGRNGAAEKVCRKILRLNPRHVQAAAGPAALVAEGG